MLKTSDLVEIADAPIKEDGLWDIDDVAAWMKVSRWKVRELYRNEGLPFIDLAGIYRYDPASVRDWVKKRISSAAS